MFNLLVLKTCGFVAVTSAKLWSYWRRIQPCIASRPGTTKATNIPAATSACCTVWRPCPGWVGCSSDLSISYNLNPTGHLLRRYHQPESLLDVFKRNMCPSELQDSFILSKIEFFKAFFHSPLKNSPYLWFYSLISPTPNIYSLLSNSTLTKRLYVFNSLSCTTNICFLFWSG